MSFLGGWIMVSPSSIVGDDGATRTVIDDCAVDGTTPVENRWCLLLILLGGIFYFKMTLQFCLTCLSQLNRFNIAINKYLLALAFELIYIQSQSDLPKQSRYQI